MNIGLNGRFLRKPGTGIGEVTLETLRALATFPDAQTHTVVVYTMEPATLPFRLPPHWRLSTLPTWYRRDDQAREYLFDRFVLPKAAARDECDAFFSPFQCASIFPRSVRHAMAVHDLAPLHFSEYRANWRQRFFYGRVLAGIHGAHTLIAPSSFTKNDIVERLGVDSTAITVAPLGIPHHVSERPTPEKTQAILTKYALSPGYVYHGGGLEKRKNTAHLLEAYADLIRTEKNVPPLVISGKVYHRDNPLATNVGELIETLDLKERVRLLGFVPDEDLAGLYAGALFFVYPSLLEGFGFPVLEAFATGTPVLTSEASSLPELAQGAASFINPRERESIREGLRRLLQDEALRRDLIARGYERAKQFSWNTFPRTALQTLLH